MMTSDTDNEELINCHLTRRKVLAMAGATGMLVRTLGYHTPQDGGGAYYLIAKVEIKEAAIGGDVIGLKHSLQARL